ncbi:MAG: hypothetical protein ACXU9U_00190 [Parachlamydiaceae bacterium]
MHKDRDLKQAKIVDTLEQKSMRVSEAVLCSAHAVQKLSGLQQAPNLTYQLLKRERGNLVSS